MKNKLNPQNWSGKLTNIIIACFGFIFILVSITIGSTKISSTILMSIGTSILATSIISFINSKYIIQEYEKKVLIENWGLTAIYRTRAESNPKANELLKKTDHLDIIAMGLKNFRDSQGTLIEQRIKRGMSLRILTIDPKSSYLEAIDDTEKIAIGATKTTIESLIKWVEMLKCKEKYNGQVEIRTYDHYPFDFYYCLDEAVFTGPYQTKTSQQTITYEFCRAGNGYKLYKENFEKLWETYENK